MAVGDQYIPKDLWAKAAAGDQAAEQKIEDRLNAYIEYVILCSDERDLF